MANTLKIKRGTAATIPQGQLAEPLFTTDTYDLYIGKGSGGNQRIQKYITSGTSSQFLKGDGSLDSNTYQTVLTFSSPLVNTSGTVSIPAATGSVNGYLTSTDWTTFNSKEPAITASTTTKYWRGDKTFQTLDTSVVPENGPIFFTEPRVLATVLTGLNLSGGGTIAATDSVLTAFGKIQNQISGIAGGVSYQTTWNASTNTPTLTSSVGTKGYYYVVSVAGSTNLNGITDWKVGDWAIFNGTTWDKVDNTDAVSSVNGFTGAVNLGLGDISNVTLSSPTNAQLLRFNGTSSKWENWTPTYISGNQTITLSGDVSGSGTTAITTTIGALKVTNAMLAGSIDYAKMDGTTVPTWNQNTTGSAATLTTARTLTIGATGKTFNGSANVSWSLAEIGAQASGNYVTTDTAQTITALKTIEFASAANYALRIKNTSATGYGVKINSGDDAYEAIRISNAADTADNIKLYGSGVSEFKGLLTVAYNTASEPYVNAIFRATGSPNLGGILVNGLSQAHVRFQVGSTTFDGAGSKQWQIRLGAGDGTDILRFYSWTKGADVMSWFSSGNVSIGNTSDAYKLDVTGTGNYNSDGVPLTLQGGGRILYFNIKASPTTGNTGVTLRTDSGSYLSLATGANPTRTGVVVDFNNNLAIQALPNSAWGTSTKVLQINDSGAVYDDGVNNTIIANNNYYTGSDNKKLKSGFSSRIILQNGSRQFNFQTAATGVVDDIITYADALVLTNTSASFSGSISGTSATFSSTLQTGDDITVSKSGDSGINLNSTTTNGVAVTRYKTTAAGNLWATGINITAGDSRWEVYNFTSGASPFRLSNSTGAATFSSSGQFGGDLTLAGGSDLIITPATSGVNAILYNDIGVLVSSASISVQGTGTFTGAVTSMTGTSNAAIKLTGFANYGTINDVNDVRRIWFENTGSYRTIFDLPASGTAFDFRTNAGTILTRINSAGSIGVGSSTISSWNSSAYVVQYGGNASTGAIGNDLHLSHNAYYDNVGWKAVATAKASNIGLYGGDINLRVSNGSITAGNAISWLIPLTIGNDGLITYTLNSQPIVVNGLYVNILLKTDSASNYQRIRYDVGSQPYWGLTREGTSNDFMISGYINTTWSDNVFRIKQTNGRILINTGTDSGSYQLQVNGSVYATAYYESSDIRLKDVLTNLYSENFSAIEFMWKDKRDEKKHWGYAAQDVMKYIPDAIEVNKDGMMTVNYNEAHTWKIAQLEAKILELEAKLK